MATEETSSKDTAPVLSCSPCKETLASAYQDKLYGKGKRVHTLHGTIKNGARIPECTVCGGKK